MVTHSTVLAWRIPWTEEPGGLSAMGLQRVGHDRMTDHHTLSISSCKISFSLLFYPSYPFSQSLMSSSLLTLPLVPISACLMSVCESYSEEQVLTRQSEIESWFLGLTSPTALYMPFRAPHLNCNNVCACLTRWHSKKMRQVSRNYSI